MCWYALPCGLLLCCKHVLPRATKHLPYPSIIVHMANALIWFSCVHSLHTLPGCSIQKSAALNSFSRHHPSCSFHSLRDLFWSSIHMQIKTVVCTCLWCDTNKQERRLHFFCRGRVSFSSDLWFKNVLSCLFSTHHF